MNLNQSFPTVTLRKKNPRRKKYQGSHSDSRDGLNRPHVLLPRTSQKPLAYSEGFSETHAPNEEEDWLDVQDYVSENWLLREVDLDSDQLTTMALDQSSPQLQVLIGNMRSDPFRCYPFPVTQVQASLVDFYVNDYARAAYSMSSRLEVGKLFFKQILQSPVELHAIISQSALELLRLQKGTPSPATRQLQLEALHHKTKVIRLVNDALSQHVSEDTVSAVISIARNELRHGDLGAAKIHFAAVRRMIREIGGRSKITLPRLLVQARGIECMFQKADISCFFDDCDVAGRVKQLQDLLTLLQFTTVDRLKYQSQNSTENYQSRWQVLVPGSLFHAILSQAVLNPRSLPESDVAPINAQIAVLLGMSMKWLHADDLTMVRAWISLRNKTLESLGIQKDDTVLNVNSLISPVIGAQDSNEIGRWWSLIDLMNAVRYLSFSWKVKLRDWLLKILEGADPGVLEKLEPFAFSYVEHV